MNKVKLSEICDIVIGRTPSRSINEYWGIGKNWVSISDMKYKYISETKEQITDFAISDARCRLVKKGTLLFSFKLTIGKVAFADKDLYTNEAIAALPVKDISKINSEYLYFALKSVKYAGSNQAVMGKTLNSKSLAEIKIPVPEKFEDQIHIANLLSQAEALIAKRKESIQLLDELLKSTFLDMFGDPVRNEKGWGKDELGKYTLMIGSGSTPKGGKDVYQRTGTYFIRSQNIRMNHIDYSDIYCISDEIHNNMKRTWVKNQDVLLNITGASIGRVATFYGKDDSANVNQHVSIIRTNKKQLLPRFLEYQIAHRNFQTKAISASAGGTRESFTFEQIKKFNVIIPIMELQIKFTQIVEKVENIKTKYQESLQELENLYASLSQKAFSPAGNLLQAGKGELDLSKMEIEQERLDIAAEEGVEYGKKESSKK